MQEVRGLGISLSLIFYPLWSYPIVDDILKVN